jgi:hypothetical protein
VATLWFGPAGAWFLDGAATSDRPPARTSPWSSSREWAPPPTSSYDVRRGIAGRPNALLTACLLTWMFCSLTVLLIGASLVVLAIDSATVLDRMHRQDPRLSDRGITDHQLLLFAYVTGGIVIAWALAAAALAALAFNRRRWAWAALLVSTTAVVVLGLVAVVGFVLVLVPLMAAVVTLVLLTRREVREWLRP